MQPAIFLDRDGVICVDKDLYEIGMLGKGILSIKDVEIYPEAKNFLETAEQNGYKIIVVTDQSKVGRGILTIEELHKINDFINKSTGGHIHVFYVCVHQKEDNCDCKKPKIGMINKALKEHPIDLKKSWMIGDKTRDIKFGENAGLKTILVKTGYAGRDKKYDAKPDYIVENLREAAKIIFGKPSS